MSQLAPRPAREADPKALELARHLAESIDLHKPDLRELRPERRDQTVVRWAEDIELAIRIDGRDPGQLKAVIDWCHRSPDGSFWRANLLSGRKLRAQFDTVTSQMERPRTPTNGNHVMAPPRQYGKNIPRPIPEEERVGPQEIATMVAKLKGERP